MAILDALIGAPGDADTLGRFPDADLSVATPCAQQLSYHHAASLLRGASCLALESTPGRYASRLAPVLLHGRWPSTTTMMVKVGSALQTSEKVS